MQVQEAQQAQKSERQATMAMQARLVEMQVDLIPSLPQYHLIVSYHIISYIISECQSRYGSGVPRHAPAAGAK